MICHAVYNNDLILKNPPYLSIFLLSNLYHTISFQELLEDLINLCVVCNCLFYTQWGWLHYTKIYIFYVRKKKGKDFFFFGKKDLKHNENILRGFGCLESGFSVYKYFSFRFSDCPYFLLVSYLIFFIIITKKKTSQPATD